MTGDIDSQLSERQNLAVATKIREEMARRRVSRQYLADQAKISLSTLEKALSGHRPFTLATTIRLEEALGMRLRAAEHPESAAPTSNNHATEEFGAYSRAAVAWIEGKYLTLRPSFGDPKAIFAYCTEIGWNDAAANLRFHEMERLDAAFTQRGTVSIPNLSGHIYLATNTSGQHRLIIVSRPSITGEMYGILTTLQAGRGAQLTPVSAPIVLIPMASTPNAEFGRIAPDHASYAAYLAYLKRTVEEPFAVFLPGPSTV
ncbi:helix-turn-helix transcriptional regulator (plasmid) [Phyllobacterium sp. 628]|uniref:helix-turn-helix domain-containing protein n=1 Tax=Phyllobacterium sp. 628 TaxID=2718938 RepID=UPI00166260B8|nr:helix-turn-helix transcriptional regulator [Phyllobacterium sp. 628]QND54948.1 helix-turn-helix transcriptional regulator [Phyllobacterium sp. 628]